MFVVAFYHVRHARQRHTRGMISGSLEVCQVPDIRDRDPQMHVVRQERLSACCVRAGNYPVVRADSACIAVRQPQRLAQFMDSERRSRAVVIVILGWWWDRLRLGHVDPLPCWWPVAPRTSWIKAPLLFAGSVQFFDF